MYSWHVHLYLPLHLNYATLYLHVAGQYYETMVRYEKFFILETQYIPGVLVSVAVSDVSADATDTGSTTVQYVILAHTIVCCLSSQTKHNTCIIFC